MYYLKGILFQNNTKEWGIDFHDNMENVKTEFGQYSTEIFTTRAEKVINEHDKTKVLRH